MRFDMRAYLPNRVSGQIVVLLIAPLIASHAIITVAFYITATMNCLSIFPINWLL